MGIDIEHPADVKDFLKTQQKKIMQPKMVQCVCLRMLSSDLCGEHGFWDFEEFSDHPDHCRKVLIIPEGISSQNVPNGPSLKAPSILMLTM